MGERVGEGAADEPCDYFRRLGSRLRAAAMTQRAESEDGAVGYGLIVFLRGLDEQSRTMALIRAREQAWDDYFNRENPQPMDERIGNEASLARMTALGAVEAVCYQLARAAGEVDNLGLPAAATRKGD